MSIMYLQVCMAGFRKYILPHLFFSVSITVACGQSASCPDNIDFEAGTLTNWECKTGRADDINGTNTITWQSTGINTLNHKLIPRTSAGTDPFGGFSEASPNGSAYSVKLGNSFFQNVSAESMAYTFAIPDTAQVFSILFYYAVVFQDPEHSPHEQPRFRTSVFNVTDNVTIDCSNFDFTASASLPGFRVSTVDTTVIYKDWTPVTLNLSRYAGKTIRLEFITSDCTFKGHFGYAYFDVNSSCSGAISGDVVCPGDTSATITAPHGFQTYTWYSDNTYSTILSTSQTLHLNPVPPAGTSMPVVVGPYAGFGCPDTIKSFIKIAVPPIANAGADANTCVGMAAQLGADAVTGYSYNWSPPQLVTSTLSATTLTIPNLTAPTNFFLAVTDTKTGCKNYDTVLVTPVLLDTAMQLGGDTVFCMNKSANTYLQVLDAGATVQWYENGNLIGGATTFILNPQPLLTTTYWAVLQKGGCTNSTRRITVTKLPLPVAGFTADPAEQCMNGPFRFINQTNEPPNTTTNYRWGVSDGRTAVTKDWQASFTAAGSYAVSLKAVTKEGCTDSTAKTIKVSSRCGIWVPTAFTPGDDGKNDWFRPYFLGAPKLKKFTVYDRNGFIVFTTTALGEGWNGRHRGIAVPSGVLVWILEYETAEGKTIFEKGTVTLIR
jgi:gliding motility-associated-like protein